MPYDGSASSTHQAVHPPPSTGVPITQIAFPRSPSQLPSWITGLSEASVSPVYTTARSQPSVPPLLSTGLGVTHGGVPASGVLYGGADGTLFHGGTLQSSATLATVPAAPAGGSSDDGPPPAPPRFYKLEFHTYDGSVDPRNWLNQCEQFFKGQRTLASDRTWLASYHLKGEAQTWYHALEQDEGMPPWERFRDLCRLRFGPPLRGSRLAELGRLPFTSTVQDFAERFQALACHALGVSTLQRAELFVGGLPEHIRADVEMQEPQDLQTAMHYARAFERRAAAMQALPPARGARPPPRPVPPGRAAAGLPTPGGQGAAAANAPPEGRVFRRLTPAEQAERRRRGLCFNCDKTYAPGHVCHRLLYIATDDCIVDEAASVEDGAAVAAVQAEEPAAQEQPDANAFVVSLHALVGITMENTMLLPVEVNGQRLVALLDTGSTHNFLHAEAMRRLGLSPRGSDQLRVTVANDDRL